jgi:hypothetical protein
MRRRPINVRFRGKADINQVIRGALFRTGSTRARGGWKIGSDKRNYRGNLGLSSDHQVNKHHLAGPGQKQHACHQERALAARVRAASRAGRGSP